MFHAAMLSIDTMNEDTNKYLDSGGTKHVTGISSQMFEVKDVGQSNVRSAGGQFHSVKDKKMYSIFV